MRWWFSGLCLASVVSSGCAATGFDRASYELGSVGGVLFSNSLLIAGRVQPQRSSNGFLLAYPLLFQNESGAVATLGLSQAVVTLNGELDHLIVRCGEHGYLPSASLSLQPGQRLRVDCSLWLSPKGRRKARAGDSEIALEVPVLSEGRLLAASFTYRLKVEDAS